MARVFIPEGLRSLTDGVAELDVEALDRRFPGIGARLDSGIAVAIDGDIVQEPLLEPISTTTEVHFLPSISGG